MQAAAYRQPRTGSRVTKRVVLGDLRMRAECDGDSSIACASVPASRLPYNDYIFHKGSALSCFIMGCNQDM